MNQYKQGELKIIASSLIGEYAYQLAGQVYQLPLEGLDKREKEFVAAHMKKLATTM